MNYTRREFMHKTGIAIAALLMARCPPIAGRKNANMTPRERLRDCWLRLDWLAQETRDNWGSDARGEQAREQLVSDHRAALDELTAAGDLDAAVAEQVQLAFSAAAYHVWRANVPITCYEPVLVNYTPTSANQLVQQANLLADLAGKSGLDPNTVAQAQAVIQRDMAFLSLSSAETEALYDAILEAAGGSYNFPTLEDLDLEISPQASEAARFLIELLLEE